MILLAFVFGGLAPLVIEKVEHADDRIVVRVSTPLVAVACPDCGVPTSRVHGLYERTVGDLPIEARRVQVMVRVRRLVCPTFGCRRTFREQVPGVCSDISGAPHGHQALVGAVARELPGRGPVAVDAGGAAVTAFHGPGAAADPTRRAAGSAGAGWDDFARPRPGGGALDPQPDARSGRQGRTVFVSLHLMSEMTLIAEHLVVIGKGRLIADVSMSGFIDRAARDSVRVRSPRVAELHDLITGPDVSTLSAERGVLEITGLPAAEIGERAARAGIPLHELTVVRPSLEEAFMELTEDAVECHATPTLTGAAR